MRIIDAHVHLVNYVCGITSKGELQEYDSYQVIDACGNIFQVLPKKYHNHFSGSDLVDLMNKNGIEKVIVLQGNYLGFNNYYVKSQMILYPDRIIGAATLDLDFRNINDILHNLFINWNFRILKLELSTGSGYFANHLDCSLDMNNLITALDFCEKNNILVFLDLGRFNTISNQVDVISRLTNKYKSINFIICHLSGPRLNDEEQLKKNLKILNNPNVYFDLAALPSNVRPDPYPYIKAQNYIKIAKDIVGAKKLIFGSDIPSTLCRDSYQNLINYIAESKIFTSEELDYVFYQNISELLKNL